MSKVKKITKVKKFSKVEKLTDANFYEKVECSEKPYLVDFWDQFFSPCIEVMKPIMHQLAKEYEGKLKVGRFNAYENKKMTKRFGITLVPTFIIFNDGEEIYKTVGGTVKFVFDEVIQKILYKFNITTTSKVENLTTATFHEKVKSSEKPYLVNFWAPWCDSCIAFAPLIDKIAEEYEDKLKVAKLNIDENGDIAEEFGVTSIPTFIIFENGEEVRRTVGEMTRDSLSITSIPTFIIFENGEEVYRMKGGMVKTDFDDEIQKIIIGQITKI